MLHGRIWILNLHTRMSINHEREKQFEPCEKKAPTHKPAVISAAPDWYLFWG